MANEINNGSNNPQFRGVNEPASPRPVPMNFQPVQANNPIPATQAPVGMAPNVSGQPENNPNDPNQKKRAPLIIAIVCVLVVAVSIFSAWWFLGGGSDFFDPNAQAGQAPYKTQEEIIAELNRIVEEGMLNISIASLIEFQDGTSQGTAYIENVPSNRYVLRVSIALDSTGEIVYQSGGLRPDSYIEKITLSEDLPAGTYPSTATFVAYDPDTLEEVGQAAAKITLVVDN